MTDEPNKPDDTDAPRKNEYLRFVAAAGESEMTRDARVEYAKAYRGIGTAEMGANFVRQVLERKLFPEMRDFVCNALGIDPEADKETAEEAFSEGREWLYNLTLEAVGEVKSVWEMECQNDKEDATDD